MKKLFHLFTLCFSLSVFSATFAYTSTDVSNAQFLAEKGIIKEQKNEKDYRLDSTISRAETVKMALAIKGVTIPTKYTCKKYFSDVTKNDWVCAAVELAADHGLVSRENQKFRPSEVISRVEILKIIINTSSLQFPV